MSLLGYFSRFIRFWLKLGPLLALAGWVMANSGQGGVGQVIQAAQDWMGLSQNTGRQWSEGINSLFGDTIGSNSRAKRRSGLFGTGGSDPISSRTRNNKKASSKRKSKASSESVGDVLGDILQSATGGGETDGDWQNVVQGYVKRAVAKASGLEWLFRQTDAENTGTR